MAFAMAEGFLLFLEVMIMIYDQVIFHSTQIISLTRTFCKFLYTRVVRRTYVNNKGFVTQGCMKLRLSSKQSAGIWKKKMSKSKKHTCEEINSEEIEIKRVKKSRKSGQRTKPNILIAGTPGTGKSSLCEKIKEIMPAEENVKVINLGEFAKENDFLGDWDDKYECHEIDEEKVLDKLEDIIATGNIIIEHHVTVRIGKSEKNFSDYFNSRLILFTGLLS